MLSGAQPEPNPLDPLNGALAFHPANAPAPMIVNNAAPTTFKPIVAPLGTAPAARFVTRGSNPVLQANLQGAGAGNNGELPGPRVAALGLTVPTNVSSTGTVTPRVTTESAAKGLPTNIVQLPLAGPTVPASTPATVSDGRDTTSVPGGTPIDGSAGSGATAGTVLYTTGFEAPGFAPGFIGSQSGWGYAANNTTQPEIVTANPNGGTQHLRLSKHSGLTAGTAVSAFSPNLGTLAAGHYAASVDVAISAAGGADYDVILQAPSQSLITARVNFRYNGDIFIVDDLGAGVVWVDTNANWTAGGYQNLTVDVDASADTIRYSYGGTLIHTGTVFRGTSVEQVVTRSDNYNLSDYGDFDNVQIQTFGAVQADLVNTRPSNWNSYVPIDIIQRAGADEHAYSGPYYDNQPLYFNFKSSNAGTVQAAGYTLRAEVTGTGGGTFSWNLTTSAGYVTGLSNDQQVGPLGAGAHTFRVWLDYTDVSDESNELNNYFERTITVLPAGTPASQPVTIAPLGVSPGASWIHQEGEITSHGATKSFSATLTAGQRISASVETPEYGGSRYGNTTDVPIPDNNTAVTSQIAISSTKAISDLDVDLSLDHRNVGDLRLFLVAPDGTRVELSTNTGGTGNHYLNTVFDDEATTAINGASASAPFTGRWRPEGLLNVLDGKSIAGTWTLEITDTVAHSTAPGTLLNWGLRVNQGLDVSLNITGPNGQLAYNDDIAGYDAAVVDLVVPATGTYTFSVGNINGNIGRYTLEAGIFESTVPIGNGAGTTDLEPLRIPGGNVAVLAYGENATAQDNYTITLNAGESVTIGATTPGGLYGPYLTVTGPGGFNAGLPSAGPSYDTVQFFTAPATGTYTLNVRSTADTSYTDVLPTGTYVLTVAISDNAANNSLAGARPISAFDYRRPVQTTSLYYGLSGKQGYWRGQISPDGEADFFSLGQFSAGQLIRVTTQREGDSQVFPLLLLANSSGQVVSWGTPFRAGTLAGVSFFETIIPQAGTYYAIVLGDMTQAGGSTPSGGAYALFYSDFGVTEDAYEQNDSKAQVDAATAGAPNSPNLGAVGEVTRIQNLCLMEDNEDFFRFQTSVTGGRNDYVRILFTHARGNLNLDVLDAAGNLIRRSQGVIDNERVSLQGLPAGVYYARIWGYNNARNPRYDLRIQTNAPAHRMTSAPFTTASQYTLKYQLGASVTSSTVPLQMGANEVIAPIARTGGDPFELVFDVRRVGTMSDSTSFQYDLLGNPSRQTDAMNRDTVFDYDGLGRLNYVDGPDFGDASVFTYDANGNVTKMVDSAAGTTEYAYDALDRLTQITLPNGLGLVAYTYDLSGRVTAITYPGGAGVSYTYDSAGRLASVTDGTDITRYTYNAAGQVATATQPNGIVATYGYDALGRLIDLAYTKAGTTVTHFHYTLDANSNRTRIDVTRASGTGSYLYGYDALNRLTGATYPDGTVVLYTYDTNGNRLSTRTDPDGAGPQAAVVENYAYGADNRLVTITGAGGVVLKQFFYDPRGNVTTVVTPTDTTRYEYDYRNLMTSATDGTNRVEYIYDGKGDRVARIVNGVRTNYVNDPNQEYTQVLAEMNGSGATQARYTYGLGRISGLLPGQSDPLYYLGDALGSTTDLTDPTGAVVTSYSYDAFGALRGTSPAGGTGNVNNSFLFTGENVDPVTKWVYLRARYYDPETGRFVAKDPSGFTNDANFYLFGSDNPTTRVDPSGERWEVRGPEWHNGVPHAYATNGTRRVDFAPTSSITSSVASSFATGGLIGGVSSLFRSYPGSYTENGRTIGYARYSVLSTTNSWDYYNCWGRASQYAAEQNRIEARGGVLLNQAAGFVGDLKNITGATVDPVTGQIVMLGTEGGTVQGLRLDDFVTAVRAIFGSAEDPGVTIDPQPGHESDRNVPQLVHLFGSLEDTDMGYVMFEADRVMKCINSARDNILDVAAGSSVPGYYSLLDRWFDRAMSTHGGSSGGTSRFWFVPNDVKLVRSDNGQSFTFDRAAVKLQTENMLIGNGAVDPDAQALADWWNANFTAIAAEAYPYPSAPGYEHSFQRLEQVARAVAFARFLYDNNIPVDFSWMENYKVPFVDTPDTTRTVFNSRTGTWTQYPYTHTITISILGGVSMDTPNTYLSGASGIQGTVLGTRPNELVQKWSTTVNGQSQTAVALSMNTSFVDGLDTRTDTDLAYKSPGDTTLALTRIYRSSTPVAGPFGYGWNFVPWDIDFNRPEFYTSYYAKQPNPYVYLNGLRSGELRINDLASGKVLTFSSSFDFRLGKANNFGLTAQDVPTFTPGGSEQPDGSTLTQDPDTLAYTLTRPDGSQVIFDFRGYLLQTIDVKGRTISYGYTNGRVTSVTDSAGQTITLNYDAQSRIVQAVGLGGESVLYTYDALGNLVEASRLRNSDHLIYTYTYNADPGTTDDDHRLASVTTPDRVVQSTTMSDIMGRTTVKGDARGNTFQNAFDPKTRTTTTTDTRSGKKTVQRTDSIGRTLVETDELGRTTQYYYDVTRVFGAQYPGGWTYMQQWGGTNRQPSLVKTPDPSRPWLYFEYDARGNVTRSEDLDRGGDANQDGIDDHPLLYQYDAQNNLTRSTDARELVTVYTYNAANQRTSMTRAHGTPLAATTTWEYYPDGHASAGRLYRETDPTGLVTQYTYDALGNMLTRTDAAGTADASTTTYGYDAFSRQTSQTDAMGRQTVWTYNGFDQVTSVRLVGPPDILTTSEYDSANGRKQRGIDANGNITAYVYNATTGDLIAQAQGVGTAEASQTRMEYDRFGNVQRIIDPAGNVTLFEYDELQRLVRKTSLGATARVLTARGTNTDILIGFSEAMQAALVDNGVDVVVKNSQGQDVAGTISFSTDGRTLTWTASAPRLAADTYTVTLKSGAAGQLETLDARWLDGEFFGLLPSGDDVAGGDFVFSWFVDDHGNDSGHGTAVAVPSGTSGTIEFFGDSDWFAFDTSAGTSHRFEVVLGSASGSLYDSVITLYDIDGKTILFQNDDIDTTLGQYGSRIDWKAPRDGTYFIKVTAMGDYYTGAYQLNNSVLADDHGDDVAHATAVLAPSVTPGTLETPSDKDTFSFTAVGGTKYRFTTILQTLPNSTLTLIGPDGLSVLASNDDFYSGNRAAFIYWTAPAGGDGTYYLQVASANGNYKGTYQLAVSEDDHGDWPAVATAISTTSQTGGSLEVKYDMDWFSFTAVAGRDYRFDVAAGTLADPFLALFDANGLLTSNDNYSGPSPAIFWHATQSGTFYLKVTGFEGSGTYTLGMTELVDDHDNTAAAATQMSTPGTMGGNIEMPGDIDFFKFTAIAGQRYRLQTSVSTLPDSVLRLYGTDGITLLGENDDFMGVNSRIDWIAPADGIYYLAVLAHGATQTGAYQVAISQPEMDAPMGRLVSPAPGSVASAGPGCVEIEWADALSGIDPGTIDASDITIGGVTVTGVTQTAPGSGVWRYTFTGTLPEGLVQVTLRAEQVADLAGNWNNQSTATFFVDTIIPAADIVDVTPDPRLNPVPQVTIRFNEFVTGVDLASFTLTRNGGANLLTEAQTLTSADGVNWTLGNLGAITSTPGVYVLTLNASGNVRDRAGRPLDASATDSFQTLAPASISGIAFNDLNGNGVRGLLEPVLANWLVYLDLNHDRAHDAGEPSVTTAADGSYQFTNLLPGTYTVAMEWRANWRQTMPLTSGGAGAVVWPANTLPIFTTGSHASAYPTGGVNPLTTTQEQQAGPPASTLVNLDLFRTDHRFQGIDGTGYAAAILDTGADLDHPFFGPDVNGDGVADRIVYQYDFGDNDANAGDVNGHGSNVASIIGSQDATYTGMAPAAGLAALKVFRNSGAGDFGMIERALQWLVAHAAEYRIVAVNMSLGDTGNYQDRAARYGLGDELAALAAMNVLVVSAAGNDFYQLQSVPGVSYPAADPNSLAVSAVWDSNRSGPWSWQSGAKDYTTGADRFTSFSQRHGALTDIAAPGSYITGAGLNGGLVSMGGTSQASPHIAGIAVLAQQLAARELGRLLTPAEFRSLLRSTAVTIHDGDDEDDNVVNTNFDFYRVDVLALGEAILAMAGPGPGTYTVTLAEGQSAGDKDFASQQQPPLTDLSFDQVTIVPDPAPATSGGPVKITRTYRVSNQAVASDFAIDYHVSVDLVWGNEDDRSFIWPTPFETLSAAGDKALGAHDLTITTLMYESLPPGTYTVLAKLDPGDVVAEADETNNVMVVGEINVFPPPLDLSWQTVSATQTRVNPGGTLNINRTFTITGREVRTSFLMLGYRLSPSGQAGPDNIELPAELITDSAQWSIGSHPGTWSVQIPGDLAPGTYTLLAWVDYSGGYVEADETNNFTTFATITVAPPTSIAGRWVFYNNCAWDGNNPAANSSDDSAIAQSPDSTPKQALLPGQTATFANYTSYSKGLNGIMLDVSGMPGAGGSLTVADFAFKVGNNNTPDLWATAPAPASVTVRAGAGAGGSDRITLIWADNVIQKQWLQVTLLANANTGLLANDVFYFGNAIGEAGNSTVNAAVDAADELLARANGTGLGTAPIHNPYDFNRDKRVNTQDQLIARSSRSGLTPVKLITVPAVAPAEPVPATAADSESPISLASDVIFAAITSPVTSASAEVAAMPPTAGTRDSRSLQTGVASAQSGTAESLFGSVPITVPAQVSAPSPTPTRPAYLPLAVQRDLFSTVATQPERDPVWT